MTNEDDEGFLVPYVLMKRHGGTYDDDAFLAGVRIGELARDLLLSVSMAMGMPAKIMPPSDKPQIELLAMAYGFVLTEHPYDDEWSIFQFSPARIVDTIEDIEEEL